MKPKYTTYEKLTHRGRQISERKSLGEGYCGSCSISVHAAQLADPDSWVHSSKDSWLKLGAKKRKL